MREALCALILAVVTIHVCAGPAEAVAAAAADVKTLSPDAAHNARYLSLYAVPERKRADLVRVLALQVNLLSSDSDLSAPAVVAPDLLRVDLRAYNWSPKTWEKFADIDVFFHAEVETYETVQEKRETTVYNGVLWAADGGKWVHADTVPAYVSRTRKVKKLAASAPWLPAADVAALIELTGSQAPILRGDWWFVQTARQLSLRDRQTGVGYYDWLNLKDRDGFFRLIHFNDKESIEIGRDLRAALDRSGVAQHGRQVQRRQALTGGAWASLDVKDPEGDSNPIQNLRPEDFRHDAEEWYGVLPNGLPVFFLSDAAGVRQDSAPDFIGFDDSDGRIGRDGRIHVCLACIRCHKEQLRPVDDYVRRTYRGPVTLESPDYEIFKQLRREYLSDLNGYLERDRAGYNGAIAAAGGVKPDELPKVYAAVWNDYAETDLTPDDLGRWHGCEGKRLVAAVKAYTVASGRTEPILAGLLADPPQPMRPEHAEESFPLIETILLGGKP